uniref:EGF-like domain-containing protein n=1 Tax=Macrostomum lignano TaxID=282301 RepID=A0A1I8H1M6_9PLAT
PTQAANCSTVTCDNGGTCNNYTVSPPCLCPLPYIAPYCRSAADYCFTLQPDKGINELPVCLNDGNCTLTYTDPYFNCSCPTGYTDSGLTTTSKVVIGVCAPVLFIIIGSFFLYIYPAGRTETLKGNRTQSHAAAGADAAGAASAEKSVKLCRD